MEITAVLLTLSDELRTAVLDALSDDPGYQQWEWRQNWEVLPSQLTLTADDVAELIGDWFRDQDEALYSYVVSEDRGLLEYPAFCSDPLLKDFVDVVLKIYRLTA